MIKLFLFLLFLDKTFAKSVEAGRVVTVAGEVTLDNIPLNQGDIIAVGQTVKTTSKSSCKLQLADKTVVDVTPDSQYKVEWVKEDGNDFQIQSRLEAGSIRASIRKRLDQKPRFHIKTKASVLAVRGTEVIVALENREGGVNEKAYVMSGVAEWIPPSGNSLMVGEGRFVSQNFNLEKDAFKPAAAPAEFMLASKDLTVLQEKSFVPDYTFSQAVDLSFNRANIEASAKPDEGPRRGDPKEKSVVAESEKKSDQPQGRETIHTLAVNSPMEKTFNEVKANPALDGQFVMPAPPRRPDPPDLAQFQKSVIEGAILVPVTVTFTP